MKARRLVGGLLVVSGAIMLLYIIGYRFWHPELTETQLFYELFWPEIVGCLGTLFSGMWIGGFND